MSEPIPQTQTPPSPSPSSETPPKAAANGKLKVVLEVAVLLLLIYALGRVLHFDPLSLLGLGPRTVVSQGAVTVSLGQVDTSAGKFRKSPDANVVVEPGPKGRTVTTIQEVGLVLDPVVGISFAGNERDSANDLQVGARFFFVGPDFGAAITGGAERLQLGPDFRYQNFDVSVGLAQDWTSFLNPSTIRPFVGVAFFPFEAPGKTAVEGSPATR